MSASTRRYICISIRRRKADMVDRCTHDCKNLLPPSSLSCSSRTVSTRSTIACKLVCNILACSMRSLRASSLSFSSSVLLRRGDIARTSSSSSSSSTTIGWLLSTIIVPLLFRLPNPGRTASLVVDELIASGISSDGETAALESADDNVGRAVMSAGVAKAGTALDSSDMVWRV